MKSTERVILVKGDATKWYNQAIFIVNKDMPATKMPVDFVAEAEKIIYGHIRATKGPSMPAAYAATAPARPVINRKKKTSTFDMTLNVVMILACIAIAAVFAYGILA